MSGSAYPSCYGFLGCMWRAIETKTWVARHLSCRVWWLQQVVKLKGKLKDAIINRAETCHVVSGVSESNNIADLGKARLAELMRFCNLGCACHDAVVAFGSDQHVVSKIKGLKFSVTEMADVPHLVAKLNIHQRALSRCGAMDSSCPIGSIVQQDRGWICRLGIHNASASNHC